MPATVEITKMRQLRRRGCARVTLDVAHTLFGHIALVIAIRRIGWEARHESWVLGDVGSVTEQISRALFRDRTLIRRFGLLLEGGVTFDITLSEGLLPLAAEIRSILTACFDHHKLSLAIVPSPGTGRILATLRDEGSATCNPDAALHPEADNVIPFPTPRRAEFTASEPLGIAFFDEPELAAMASRLYPHGIRNIGDLCAVGLESIVKLLKRSNVHRTMIHFEGWTVEKGIQMA